MNKKILAILLLVVGLLVRQTIWAEDETELYEKYTEKQDEIIKLQQDIEANRGKQKTLASTIAFLDDKIELAELEIAQTEESLEKLREEIATLNVKIDRLDTELNKIAQILITRVGEAYKRSHFQPMYLLLNSGGFADWLEGSKYLSLAQANDQKLLLEMQNTKDATEAQKNIKQTKQAELNSLQETLKAQKKELDYQLKGKQELLAITRNDERRFQALLTAVQADLASITNALAGGGVKIGKVKKSDVIGTVGSSGCSTGPHLHFEVFEGAKIENGGLVQGNRVNPKPYLEGGQYQDPVPNYPANVTTWYGEVYFLGIHTGIDVWNNFGTPIHPILDGVAYFVSSPCPYNISGGTSLGKGILVDHENGLASLYWHIP